jgi:hypothetical protein
LIDVHLPPVNIQNEVKLGLSRGQRPELRVASYSADHNY